MSDEFSNPEDLANVSITNRTLIRRLVIEATVNGVATMQRPRQGGGVITFMPKTIRAIYEFRNGIWTIARVIVRGIRLGCSRRNTQIEYNNATLSDAPTWVTRFVYPNRPLADTI